MHRDDHPGATRSLNAATLYAPQSSDVHNYWGELYFQQNKIDKAIEKFEKAIECDPMNPTVYVNLALTKFRKLQEMGINPAEETPAIIALFEKSFEVDPMYTTSYLHLGQLKLSLARKSEDVDEVIELYNRGIVRSRLIEEIMDLLQALIMAKAQKRAAELLGMTVFDMVPGKEA